MKECCPANRNPRILLKGASFPEIWYVYQLKIMLINNNVLSPYRYDAEAVFLAANGEIRSINVKRKQKCQNPAWAPILSRNWVCQLKMNLTDNNCILSYRQDGEAVLLATGGGIVSSNVLWRQKPQNPAGAPILSRNLVCISINNAFYK